MDAQYKLEILAKLFTILEGGVDCLGEIVKELHDINEHGIRVHNPK